MNLNCSVCGWVNIGLLNLGEPGGNPKWMCHGCIKRELDAKTKAMKELCAASEAMLNYYKEKWPASRAHDNLKAKVENAKEVLK